MDEEPKAKSKSVSLQPELWDRVEAKAAAHYGANRSAYIRELVLNDLDGHVDLSLLSGETPIHQLADALHPTLAGELAVALDEKEANQGRILARFLEALLEALKRKDDFDPAEPFHLYNSLDQLTTHVTRTAPGIAFMRTLEEMLRAHEERAPMAAEDPAPFNPPKVTPALLDELIRTKPAAISSATGPVDAAASAEDKRRAEEAARAAAAAGRKPAESERRPRKTKD